MKPTLDQQRGHAIATRGMDKTAALQAKQLATSRTERQRRERQPVQCICCTNYRDPRSYPICDDCMERHHMGVQG
jgi:hypothetical protein